jgi:hypothetical protein
MAAKRYWRIFILHNDNNGFLGIDKIKMAAVPGGANLATVPANASASSTQGAGLGADQCFLGTAPNTGTLWQTDSGKYTNYGYGQWVKYDFGAGNEQTINEVLIAPNWGAVSRTPMSFRIQSSNDNVTWLDEWCGIYSAWVVGTFVSFTRPAAIPGAASYWGVMGLQTSQPYVAPQFGIANLWFRDGPGGAILSTGGTALASRTDSGPASNAFDGNAATIWEADGYTDTVSAFLIGYQFAAPVAPAWVDMQSRDNTSFSNHLKANNGGEIWVSNDGRNWLVKTAYAMPAFNAASQTQGFAISAPEGVIVDQLLLVAIDYEYEIQNRYVRFGLSGANMSISPMFIQ